MGLTAVLYGPSVDEFLYKDDFVLLQRARDHGFLETVFGRTLRHLEREGETAYWRPGWWLLVKLDHACFGTAAAAHRCVGLALHAALVLGVLSIAARQSKSLVAGFLGALLFATSPAYVEAVTWMAAATNVLPAAALILVSGVAWQAHLERGSPRALAASLSAFALALLFREAAYHLPLVFVLGWWCFGRGTRALRSLALALALSGAAIAVHYGLLNQQRSPPLSPERLLENAQRFAAAFVPLPSRAPLVLAGSAAALLLLAWPGSARTRYFLGWGIAATVPYIAVQSASRFLYFAAPPLAIGLAVGCRELARRGGRRLELALASLAVVAAAGQALTFGRALGTQLEKPRTARAVLEGCRELDLARFDRLGVARLPLPLWPGFDALLDLHLGLKVEIDNVLVDPRPPFAVHLHPVPAEAPGTAFLIFQGNVPRLCSRSELFGGLIPIPMVSFPRRWSVVAGAEEALRRIRSGAVDLEREVLLLDEPQLAYDEAAPPTTLRRIESTGEEVVLEIDCPANTLLVLALASSSAQVTVDGLPARTLGADGRFQAIELPAGTRRVVWKGRVNA